mgnify:CR=1 FL=1
MRIHIELKTTKDLLPFNHQELLVSALHRWLGDNDFHDKLSLYSFSRLMGGKAKNGGLFFPDGAKWFISFYDKEKFDRLTSGIITHPEIGQGLRVESFWEQPVPDLSVQSHFLPASPIFIKRNIDGKQKHFLYSDDETSELLTETLMHKMRLAGIENEEVNIYFDKNYYRANTKLVNYKGIKNRANMCAVYIEGSAKAKDFAWHVGLGNSTGIGFGAIM